MAVTCPRPPLVTRRCPAMEFRHRQQRPSRSRASRRSTRRSIRGTRAPSCCLMVHQPKIGGSLQLPRRAGPTPSRCCTATIPPARPTRAAARGRTQPAPNRRTTRVSRTWRRRSQRVGSSSSLPASTCSTHSVRASWRRVRRAGATRGGVTRRGACREPASGLSVAPLPRSSQPALTNGAMRLGRPCPNALR